MLSFLISERYVVANKVCAALLLEIRHSDCCILFTVMNPIAHFYANFLPLSAQLLLAA